MLRFALLLTLTAALSQTARAQNYAFSTLAGVPADGGPVDGPAAVARFSADALATDAAGNLFFADAYASTIRRMAADGTVSTYAGVSGQAGYADGPVAQARFTRPAGLAFDANGNLYVADTGNYVVRKITPDGAVSTLAGQAGTHGEQDGNGTGASFGYLQSLAVDPQGNVFVGDVWRIREITPAGVVSTPYVAAAGGALATPFSPAGLAFDRAGNLYVADSAGRTIRKITPDGTITILAGRIGNYGAVDGQGDAARFFTPSAVAVDASQNVLVADQVSRLIRRVAPDGTVTSIAGQPDREYRGSDGVGGNAVFQSPTALAVDASGNVYVTDGYQTVLRKGVPTAQPSPPILTITPAKSVGSWWSDIFHSVGEWGTVPFAVQAAGTPPFSYQWLKDGAAISGATDATFTLSPAMASDEGKYTVQVTNPGGTYTPSAVTLRVYTPPFGAFSVRHATPGGSWLWGITSGAGRLVTVGSGGTILTSDDGQTWTPRASGTTEWLVNVGYAEGKFVAVGDHGTLLVSTDGTTWAPVASGTAQRLNGIGFGAGRFVVVGEAGTILTSTDAQTWTAANSGVTTWLRGVVYVPRVTEPPDIDGDNGTGRFYISGAQGVILEGDGMTWTRDNWGGNTADIEALTDGPIGVGQDGVLAHLETWHNYAKGGIRLPDGTWVVPGIVTRSWLTSNIGLAARFRGLVRGAGAIFATGENGVIAAAQQVTGPWSFIPSGTTSNLVAGVFQGNTLYVVGENETILQSVPLYDSRLINLSARGDLRGAGDTLISGVVVSGTAPKMILLRAPGPALRDFGVAAPLTEPTLTLFDSTGHAVAANTGWDTAANAADIAAATARVGAFPFADGSADSALLLSLAPGSYTAHVTGTAAGVAMLEAYDADTAASGGSREVNLSTRGWVGTGDQKLIAGFVINGAAARRVLIRAVGPSLAQFGVGGVLAAPQLDLYNAANFKLQSAGPWSLQPNADEVRTAGVIAGAFPLADGSNDAAIVMTLLPGSYTAQISGANGTTGEAMIEVYDLP